MAEAYFSLRIPDEAMDCWVKHFFAVVERRKEMTQVWNCKYSKVVEWDGDPQNAPDTCETCSGAGATHKIPLEKLEVRGGTVYLSTEHLPEALDCPECKGYGMVYFE